MQSLYYNVQMFTDVFLNTTSNSGRPYVLKYPSTPERNIRMESHILAKVKKWNVYGFFIPRFLTNLCVESSR